MDDHVNPKTTQETDAMTEAMHEVEEARTAVSAELDHLRHKVKVALDWRDWIGRHAVACLATAFGVGVLLGRRR